jgi:hypothetical protein
MPVWKSTSRWTELPVAPPNSTYLAAQVKKMKILVGVLAVLTVLALAGGFTTGFLHHWSDNSLWNPAVYAAIPGFLLVLAWVALRQSNKLERLASAPPDQLNWR